MKKTLALFIAGLLSLPLISCSLPKELKETEGTVSASIEYTLDGSGAVHQSHWEGNATCYVPRRDTSNLSTTVYLDKGERGKFYIRITPDTQSIFARLPMDSYGLQVNPPNTRLTEVSHLVNQKGHIFNPYGDNSPIRYGPWEVPHGTIKDIKVTCDGNKL